MLKDRMVNMFCSKQIWSTWPHCNTENCRRGRYDATDITNINTLAAARVIQGSHTLQKTQGNGLSMVNQGNLGDLPSSSGNFWKTAKSQGILREWVYMADLKCSRQKHWRNKPFTNSPRVNICNIYLPMVNWWMACIHPNNDVHFHFVKILML